MWDAVRCIRQIFSEGEVHDDDGPLLRQLTAEDYCHVKSAHLPLHSGTAALYTLLHAAGARQALVGSGQVCQGLLSHDHLCKRLSG